ncbi:MAG TPA: cation:proton antiporter [Cytophagaceae bacterium]|nr:cation:proton antiporter [Cytophagaceae bacterium]
MKKNLILYIIIMSIFSLSIWWILEKGKTLVPAKQLSVTTLTTNSAVTATALSSEGFWHQLSHNINHPLSLLLLQIIVILFAARFFGMIFAKLGQPSVVGEIIAGIILGPSVMGLLYPDFLNFLFPSASLKNLHFLSQIGLTFFMFLVGMELDLHKVKNKAHDAVVISHSSIIVPFFLGVGLSFFIYERFAPANVSFLVFTLFMGIAMSITAFPVLARIVKDRGLTKSTLGVMAISCAAADDVTAWCILAVVVAIAKAGSFVSSIYTIIPAIAFIFVMLFVIRPWLKKLVDNSTPTENLNKTLVTVMFLTLLLSSYFAEIIGIHSLFGAFMAGTIMPQGSRVRELLTEKIEDISVIIFLPIVFAVTGLRTQIGLLNEGNLWLICFIVILVAVLGKFGGSSIAARLVGQSWKDALSIGALMNTRGLMELVVLNIGYDLGILSPEIFAILVLMALTTTFMTGPLLDLIKYFYFQSASATRAMNNIKHNSSATSRSL